MTVGEGAGVTVVDLYSGCGGLSLGAELAGFRSLAAIDIDGTLQSGYRRNFPNTTALEADLSEIDATVWHRLLGRQRPDGVIGGPPCQGFSPIGKRLASDPRNTQLAEFYRHVELLRPKFFVMENVEGLLHRDKRPFLDAALENVPSWYKVLEPFTVNATHFGAATTRTRVVVIGYDPREMDPITPAMFTQPAAATPVTVRDAISDLPSPVPELKGDVDFGWAKYPPRAP